MSPGLLAISSVEANKRHSLSLPDAVQAVDGLVRVRGLLQSLRMLACVPTTHDDNFHIPAGAG